MARQTARSGNSGSPTKGMAFFTFEA